MKCQKCGGKTKICNSRSHIPVIHGIDRDSTYRSHSCVDCGSKMKTIEIPVNDFNEIAKSARISLLERLLAEEVK